MGPSGRQGVLRSVIDLEVIVEKLDELIAATNAASVPFGVRWLDAAAIGALIGYSGRHVAERIACKPSFPKPVRLDGGHPRWKVSEVLDWIEAQRDVVTGRRRT